MQEEQTKISFEEALAEFIKMLEAVQRSYYNEEDWKDNFYEKHVGVLKRAGGRKYIKFVNGSSVTCFVDKTNGNIYKPASWKAPTLNAARGNIYHEDKGRSAFNVHGRVRYL